MRIFTNVSKAVPVHDRYGLGVEHIYFPGNQILYSFCLKTFVVPNLRRSSGIQAVGAIFAAAFQRTRNSFQFPFGLKFVFFAGNGFLYLMINERNKLR